MSSIAGLEPLVGACRHRARQRAYEALTRQLNDAQREALDVVLPSQDQTRQRSAAVKGFTRLLIAFLKTEPAGL